MSEGQERESEGSQVLPFYLVLDVSLSMEDDGKLESADQILPELADAFRENPIVKDKVRLSVIDFAGEATVLLPMTDFRNITELPSLATRPTGTSYAAALRMLRDQIDLDVRTLKADKKRVHRPAVFFVSDGAPTDTNPNDWRDAFTQLTAYDPVSKQGFASYPNFIPCGVDEADPQILKELIHPKSRVDKDGRKHRGMPYLVQKAGTSAAIGLAEIANVLVRSIVSSANDVAKGGGGTAALTTAVEEAEDLDVEYFDDEWL